MEQHQTAESEMTPALTVDSHDIAAWIGLGHKRFQNMLAGGELPGFPDPVPLPGWRRWFRSHIQEWLAGLEEAARKGTQPQPVRSGRKPGRPRQVEEIAKAQKQGEEWLAGLEEAARKGTQSQPVRSGRKPGRPLQVEQFRCQPAAQASSATHQK